MSTTNKELGSIHLKWSQKGGTVIVEDADEDRFCMTIEDAIEACRVYDKEKRLAFRKQFNMLLEFLGSWCYERKGKIQKIFLTIRDAGLLFLVVTKSKIYDEQLEEELTLLDIEIANNEKFSEILLSVQSLPCCNDSNYSSFCYPERTLEYTK
ncbi:MAG: hypothetical protein KAI59_06835 [Planctomycetes bacterium]|nr:hypothetical protein [Planctomycetota bacterium]MCK5473733.1 hypothetical protein [Planctomycetota bacterium]